MEILKKYKHQYIHKIYTMVIYTQKNIEIYTSIYMQIYKFLKRVITRNTCTMLCGTGYFNARAGITRPWCHCRPSTV